MNGLRARLIGIIGTCLLTTIGACGSSGDLSERLNGPLAVLAESGSVSLDAPLFSPWHGTFGSFEVCVNDERPVILDAVSFSFRVAPKRTPRVVVHVDPKDESGTISAQASLERLQRRPYFKGDVRPLSGFEVDIPCESYEETPRMIELLLEFEAGTEGVWVEHATVHYHDADQNSYEARIPWRMILCGSAIEPDEDGHDYCDRA